MWETLHGFVQAPAKLAIAAGFLIPFATIDADAA